MKIANYGPIAVVAAAVAMLVAGPCRALPVGPDHGASQREVASDIVQVAAKKNPPRNSSYSSYGSYRPNPSPPGGWNVQRGGVSLPPSSLMASDSRLKEAMAPLKQLDNGIELYRFRYKGDPEVYVGVIAQQVARLVPDAVVRGEDGYLRVDYDRLGLRLMTWAEWKLSQASPN
jgi:hypothetical protein